MSDRTYMFLDESGNLDFTGRGTRYFVLASLSLQRPFPWTAALDELRYECIERGLDLEYLHCAYDNRHVRDRVFRVLAKHSDAMRLDFVVAEKTGVCPALRDDARFYSAILETLLKRAIPLEVSSGKTTELIVITDRIPVRTKRRAVEKAARRVLARMLPKPAAYRLLHHASKSHYGLQVADYCCWAVHRKWQTGESTWFDMLSAAIRTQSLVCGEEGAGCE